MNHVKSTFFRTIAILCLLVLALMPVLETQAQSTPTLTLQAQPAFDGYFKYGEWLPVWVTLENQGSDLNGEVSVRVTGSGGAMIFVAPVELPAGARKRMPVYVLANNFSRSLQIQYDSGGETLATQDVTIQPQLNSSFFIGIVSPQRGALNQLNGLTLPGQTRKVFLIDLQLEQIPPRYESLRSLDVIIFNVQDTSSLNPEQINSLDLWVRQGGRLVLGGGALAQETAASLESLGLPLLPTQTLETTDVSALSAFPGGEQPGLAEGSYIIAQGALAPDARLLAGTLDQPLVVEAARDKGNIDFIALDLSQAPFEGWSGVLPFWQTLLSPGAAYPSWLSADISSRQQMASQMSYALQNLPMLDLPSVKGLALLLGLYILVIGPLNYLLLRWQNRLHWAWITIPVITLIFSLSAFGLGYAMHGSDTFVNKVSLIETGEGGQAAFTSYIGLFSPAQSGYEIEVPGDGLLSPLSPYYNPWDSFGTDAGISGGRSVRLVQTDPAYIQGLTVDQWSMQSFMVEGLEFDFGGITSDLVVQNDLLSGSITNNSGYLLKDVTVVFTRRFQRLGDLPAGETLQLNLDLSGIGTPTFGSPVSYLIYEEQLNAASASGRTPRDLEVKRSILEALFQWGTPVKAASAGQSGKTSSLIQTPVFIGWLDDAPPEVKIRGEAPAQQSTSLVYSLLPFNLPSDDTISLPTGLIPGSMVQIPAEGGFCGETGSTAVYLFRGEAIFEFYLPAQLLEMQVEQLKFGVWSDVGIVNPPQTAIYNWQSETWLNLDGLATGENLIPAADGLLSETGTLRIRMTGDQTSQGCFYLGMGVDGLPAAK